MIWFLSYIPRISAKFWFYHIRLDQKLNFHCLFFHMYTVLCMALVIRTGVRQKSTLLQWPLWRRTHAPKNHPHQYCDHSSWHCSCYRFTHITATHAWGYSGRENNTRSRGSGLCSTNICPSLGKDKQALVSPKRTRGTARSPLPCLTTRRHADARLMTVTHTCTWDISSEVRKLRGVEGMQDWLKNQETGVPALF